MTPPRPRISTVAVAGGGGPRRPWPEGMRAPVFQSATFALDATAYADIRHTGGRNTWWYTRVGNPTVAAAAARVAALEGGDAALLFSSGMGAITTTLLGLAPPGGRIVAARELYGDVSTLLSGPLADAGRHTTFVDIADPDGWRRALGDGAAVLYVETLSNPMLRVADLPALSRLAHDAGAVAVADATFTSPVNVRALEHGFDVVVQSATKYLGGHSDLVAGAVVADEAIVERLAPLAATVGACLDPSAASLLDRSLKTLAIRMERHNGNALTVARAMERHGEVEAVAYPLLESHPDKGVAARLLAGGSGLVTLRLRGGDTRAARFMDALRLVTQAPSLGGVESLVSAPFQTSHVGLSEPERDAMGIRPGTVRLSVGIEDPDDIVADLEDALARSAGPPARVPAA